MIEGVPGLGGVPTAWKRFTLGTWFVQLLLLVALILALWAFDGRYSSWGVPLLVASVAVIAIREAVLFFLRHRRGQH